jgi:hypothetical protein
VLLLRLAVLELAEVHDPADRRLGHRRDLDQVELGRLGLRQGFGQRDDAELLAFFSYQTDFRGVDLAVDPLCFVLGYRNVSTLTKTNRAARS